MTDIFFSYSSKDRERVRPVRDALAAQGFDVFWDQQVPAGVDWDAWIRGHLNRSKCAIVFWSANSVASDNVRHEATVAKQAGKLIPVLIEELRADQFPMGLYSVQGANLAGWSGAVEEPAWQKLQAELETKLTPLWVAAKLHDAEAATLVERARREAAEGRIGALQSRLAKEAQTQHATQSELRTALSEIETLKERVQELMREKVDTQSLMRALREEIASREPVAVAGHAAITPEATESASSEAAEEHNPSRRRFKAASILGIFSLACWAIAVLQGRLNGSEILLLFFGYAAIFGLVYMLRPGRIEKVPKIMQAMIFAVLGPLLFFNVLFGVTYGVLGLK